MIWGQLRPHTHLYFPLLKAFEKVPRSSFVSPNYRECCYYDADVPLCSSGEEMRFLLAPLTLGKLLSQINLKKLIQQEGQVLILSGGTGYSAALFGEMGINCFMIETQLELATQAQENLKSYPSVSIYNQYPDPDNFFDVIIMDGGAVQVISKRFLEYLTPSGYMLALYAQNDSLSQNFSMGQGVKILADQTQTVLFDVSASLNPEFKAPVEFEF
jgi:protein-L-isoaspartate(D-aspartate) O-methyltransferase